MKRIVPSSTQRRHNAHAGSQSQVFRPASALLPICTERRRRDTSSSRDRQLIVHASSPAHSVISNPRLGVEESLFSSIFDSPFSNFLFLAQCDLCAIARFLRNKIPLLFRISLGAPPLLSKGGSDAVFPCRGGACPARFRHLPCRARHVCSEPRRAVAREAQAAEPRHILAQPVRAGNKSQQIPSAVGAPPLPHAIAS